MNMLSSEVYESYPDVPWHELYGLRNRIVHGYDKVNKSIVWATVVKDLPVIKESIESIVHN